jgi:N-ethylmaleimide reductase
VSFGDTSVRNRIGMSPMGRRRADADGTPNDLTTEHYGQRASAGLIVTGSAHWAITGKGKPGSPHLIDKKDLRRDPVVEAVHGRGGRIVLQLMPAARSVPSY